MRNKASTLSDMMEASAERSKDGAQTRWKLGGLEGVLIDAGQRSSSHGPPSCHATRRQRCQSIQGLGVDETDDDMAHRTTPRQVTVRYIAVRWPTGRKIRRGSHFGFDSRGRGKTAGPQKRLGPRMQCRAPVARASEKPKLLYTVPYAVSPQRNGTCGL